MSALGRLVAWVDRRLGLSNTVLRPVPVYAIGPGNWLGALAIVSFVILGITGVLMLPYYVPTPDSAYPSTTNILTNVSFGSLVESVHLYAAYSMILFAFLHLMRGYFTSVQKSPRELMWMVGVAMGLATLFSGFTGYLLPWTVISKSATDVSIGVMNFLPDPIRGPTLYVIAGSGSNADLLSHFFALHVVVLPGLLTVLFLLKLHMFEVHGVSRPESTRKPLNAERIQLAMKKGSPDADERVRLVPWFPFVAVYMLMLTAVFASILVFVAAVFPLQLPPAYSPAAAASYQPEPEWYFLWVYQLFKISTFEGQLVVAAIGVVVALAVLLFVFPLFDRSKRVDYRRRPLYTSIGITMIYELLALSVWGAVTPGQTIPATHALTVLVAPAAVVIGAGFLRGRRRTTTVDAAATIPRGDH